jgi:hypothetical protein
VFKEFLGRAEDFGGRGGKRRYIISGAEDEPGPRNLIL